MLDVDVVVVVFNALDRVVYLCTRACTQAEEASSSTDEAVCPIRKRRQLIPHTLPCNAVF
jgi:hypothetical protein